MSHHLHRRLRQQDPNKNRKKETMVDLTSDESREFQEEEVVWAKVVGHPWWPAVIADKSYPTYHFDEESARLKRKEVTYQVSFFGESTHAFLQESKIAEYLPNRTYFIELALKQNRRCNIDNFRESVRQADLISDNPYEVAQVPSVVATPRKERGFMEEQRTAAKEEKQEWSEEQQKTTRKTIKNISQPQNKLIFFPFKVTSTHKKISQFMLRSLKSKNKGKYTLQTLKHVVVGALRKEKCLKRIEKRNPDKILDWIHSILAMNMDEIVHEYCKRSQISLEKVTLEVKKSPLSQAEPSTYIYFNELGKQIISQEPLIPFDFQIQL